MTQIKVIHVFRNNSSNVFIFSKLSFTCYKTFSNDNDSIATMTVFRKVRGYSGR